VPCGFPALGQPAQLVGAVVHTPHGDALQRLAHDVAAHLGVADLTLAAGDGHLDHAEPEPDRAPGQVDLEAVALGGHLLQPHGAQGVRAVGAVPGRRVVDRHAEQGARVEVATDAERLAVQRPVDDRAAPHPPRPDDEVGALQRVQEALELLGLVGAVGVHLDEGVVAAVQAPAEAGEVGHAEALLRGAVQHVDLGVGGGELVGDVTGAVRRAVVEHEDVRPGHGGTDAAHDQRQVVSLVVRRDAHEHPVDLVRQRRLPFVSRPTLSGRRRPRP